MSCIEKMTIQGIRSYGPKDQDTQVIEFFFPVTLIVGQNGCGKTTVIECLKFATTSDMPPNTKGTSFVFDPKLIDEVETKGRIKLYFRDTSGLSVQVQKNLCSTQKAKKLEFRTAETIISRYSNEGKLLSTITSKCINADAEVVNAFGVSKAVLEHVIFCHQEDSNWPLSEGKVLKTRFDEIFAATKYIKALDVLRKIRLEKTQLIKQKEIEKKFLESSKNHADDLGRELAECSQRHENFEVKRQAIVEQLKPVQKQIEKYFLHSGKIVEIRSQLDRIENEKQLLEKQIKELLVLTKHCLFSGTDAELKEHVAEYTATTDIMRREGQESELKNIEMVNGQLNDLNQRHSKLKVEIGVLENKQTNYEKNRVKLLTLLRKTATQIGIVLAEDTQQEELEKFMIKFTDYLQCYKAETVVIERQHRAAENEIQLKIENERDAKSKIDQSIDTKKELIDKSRQQLAKIEQELSSIPDDDVMRLLNRDIEACDGELESKLAGMGDIETAKRDLGGLEIQRTQLREKEMGLDVKLNKLHAQSKVHSELDMLNKDRDGKIEQIRKLRITVNEEMNVLFKGEMIEDEKLKEVYEEKVRRIQSELSGLEGKFREVEKRHTGNELRKKMMLEEMRGKETQMRKHEDQLLTELSDLISSTEDIECFDSFLEKLQEEHKSNMDEKGFLNGVDKTYKRFISQMQETKPTRRNVNACGACPVCSRDFKDQQEVDDTIRELKTFSQKIPKKMHAIDEKLTETELKLQRVISLKPTKETYERLKNVEISELREQIESLERNVTPKLKRELLETETLIKNAEKIKTAAETMQTEVVLIDKYCNEIAQLQGKIDDQHRLIQSSKEGESTDDEEDETSPLDRIKQMKASVQSKLVEINRRIEGIQAEVAMNYADQDDVNVLKEKLNELKQRKTDLQGRAQRKCQMDEKRYELEKEITQAKEDIEWLKRKLNELGDSITSLSLLKEQSVEENREVVSERGKIVNQLEMARNGIDELVRDNRMYEESEAGRLVEARQSLKRLEGDQKELNIELEKHRGRLEDLKLELARQEIKHRELNDNLLLRSKRKEYAVRVEAFEAKKKEMDVIDANFNIKTFQAERERTEAREADLKKELNEVQTRMSMLEGKIQTLSEELESDNYKGVYDKWSVCAIDLRVLEVSIVDIEKYYKALDRAVMNYHMIKMNEINKTIRQLWRQVYRGNDIDYVEIRSEEESGEEVQLKSRRTYNYRVVLVKGDCALDMRGRCSAGQKVLASIIIRLALAEVFCLNSGILALDEPTTNLDRENIESLAGALLEIIKTRSRQKNFQLIIITHDEDFVEMLGRSEYMESFYRVKKDENGFSKISRRTNVDGF